MSTAEKTFRSVKDAVSALTSASFSVKQTIENNGPDLEEILNLPSHAVESQVVGSLAANAARDRPTGNGVGWGEAWINVQADSIAYSTRNGLRFGWDVHEGASNPSSVTAWVKHPSGTFARDSSLGQALEEEGFDVEWEHTQNALETFARFEQAALDRAHVERGDDEHQLVVRTSAGEYVFDFGVIEDGIGAQITYPGGRKSGTTFTDPEAFAGWVTKDRMPIEQTRTRW